MPTPLEGGSFVTTPHEGHAIHQGTLSIRPRVGRATGADAISLRILEAAPGLSPGWTNPTADELLFVVRGAGTIFLDGHGFPVEPDCGLFVAPGKAVTVANPGKDALVLASSRCPEPDGRTRFTEAVTVPRGEAPQPAPVVRLQDQGVETVSDRWFCHLVGHRAGSLRVTQFVGAIPPGRAPDHYHLYEEVIYILAGEGRMWAGARSAPVAAGSGIYLPPRQVHCIENTGSREIVLVGVFYPAGSPAAAHEA